MRDRREGEGGEDEERDIGGRRGGVSKRRVTREMF